MHWINSLVFRFCTSVLGLVLFRITDLIADLISTLKRALDLKRRHCTLLTSQQRRKVKTSCHNECLWQEVVESSLLWLPPVHPSRSLAADHAHQRHAPPLPFQLRQCWVSVSQCREGERVDIVFISRGPLSFYLSKDPKHERFKRTLFQYQDKTQHANK